MTIEGSVKLTLDDLTLDELRALLADAREILRLKRLKASRFQAELEKAARSSGLNPHEIELLFR